MWKNRNGIWNFLGIEWKGMEMNDFITTLLLCYFINMSSISFPHISLPQQEKGIEYNILVCLHPWPQLMFHNISNTWLPPIKNTLISTKEHSRVLYRRPLSHSEYEPPSLTTTSQLIWPINTKSSSNAYEECQEDKLC